MSNSESTTVESSGTAEANDDSTAQQEIPPPELPTVPQGLETPCAKLVCLWVGIRGGCTVPDLQDNLGMQRITLYAILDQLEKQGVVTRRDDGLIVRVRVD